MHHIAAYHRFLDRLPATIQRTLPPGVRIENMTYETPSVIYLPTDVLQPSAPRIQTPEYALQHRQPYQTYLVGDVICSSPVPTTAPLRYERQRLVTVPIMVGSRLCVYGATATVEGGVERYGYFVRPNDGSARVFVGRLRHNPNNVSVVADAENDTILVARYRKLRVSYDSATQLVTVSHKTQKVSPRNLFDYLRSVVPRIQTDDDIVAACTMNCPLLTPILVPTMRKQDARLVLQRDAGDTSTLLWEIRPVDVKETSEGSEKEQQQQMDEDKRKQRREEHVQQVAYMVWRLLRVVRGMDPVCTMEDSVELVDVWLARYYRECAERALRHGQKPDKKVLSIPLRFERMVEHTDSRVVFSIGIRDGSHWVKWRTQDSPLYRVVVRSSNHTPLFGRVDVYVDELTAAARVTTALPSWMQTRMEEALRYHLQLQHTTDTNNVRVIVDGRWVGYVGDAVESSPLVLCEKLRVLFNHPAFKENTEGSCSNMSQRSSGPSHLQGVGCAVEREATVDGCHVSVTFSYARAEISINSSEGRIVRPVYRRCVYSVSHERVMYDDDKKELYWLDVEEESAALIAPVSFQTLMLRESTVARNVPAFPFYTHFELDTLGETGMHSRTSLQALLFPNYQPYRNNVAVVRAYASGVSVAGQRPLLSLGTEYGGGGGGGVHATVAVLSTGGVDVLVKSSFWERLFAAEEEVDNTARLTTRSGISVGHGGSTTVAFLSDVDMPYATDTGLIPDLVLSPVYLASDNTMSLAHVLQEIGVSCSVLCVGPQRSPYYHGSTGLCMQEATGVYTGVVYCWAGRSKRSQQDALTTTTPTTVPVWVSGETGLPMTPGQATHKDDAYVRLDRRWMQTWSNLATRYNVGAYLVTDKHVHTNVQRYEEPSAKWFNTTEPRHINSGSTTTTTARLTSMLGGGSNSSTSSSVKSQQMDTSSDTDVIASISHPSVNTSDISDTVSNRDNDVPEAVSGSSSSSSTSLATLASASAPSLHQQQLPPQYARLLTPAQQQKVLAIVDPDKRRQVLDNLQRMAATSTSSPGVSPPPSSSSSTPAPITSRLFHSMPTKQQVEGLSSAMDSLLTELRDETWADVNQKQQQQQQQQRSPSVTTRSYRVPSADEALFDRMPLVSPSSPSKGSSNSTSNNNDGSGSIIDSIGSNSSSISSSSDTGSGDSTKKRIILSL